MAETAIPVWKTNCWFLQYTPEITEDMFNHVIQVLKENKVIPGGKNSEIMFEHFKHLKYLRSWSSNVNKYRISNNTHGYKTEVFVKDFVSAPVTPAPSNDWIGRVWFLRYVPEITEDIFIKILAALKSAGKTFNKLGVELNYINFCRAGYLRTYASNITYFSIDHDKVGGNIAPIEVFAENFISIPSMLSSDDQLKKYARDNYPVGTKYIPINADGKVDLSFLEPSIAGHVPEHGGKGRIFVSKGARTGYVYANGKWVDVISELVEAVPSRLIPSEAQHVWTPKFKAGDIIRHKFTSNAKFKITGLDNKPKCPGYFLNNSSNSNSQGYIEENYELDVSTEQESIPAPTKKVWIPKFKVGDCFYDANRIVCTIMEVGKDKMNAYRMDHTGTNFWMESTVEGLEQLMNAPADNSWMGYAEQVYHQKLLQSASELLGITLIPLENKHVPIVNLDPFDPTHFL
jgi:hypothetical protein